MLIHKLEHYAKKNNLLKIIFNTNKKSSAVKFYKKIGYKLSKDTICFGKKIKK